MAEQIFNSRYVGPGTGAKVPIYGPAAMVKAKLRATVRRSFDSGRLSPGQYQMRIRRMTEKSTDEKVIDECYLSDLNEVTMQPLSYPNTALLGLKIKLGEQINGMPNVSFVHGGKIVRVHGKPYPQATVEEWHDAASRNPAWIVWNMLISTRYGAGLPTSRLDYGAFKRWATYCEAEGLTWDGPIDTEMNVWDACQYVLRCGRAQIVNIGTRYTVVVERAAAPVMMFSVANMVKDSYKETWLAMNDRANEIDVTYFDKDDLYKQRTVKVYDPAALTQGAKQRNSSVTLYGVTSASRAYEEAMFMLNLNRFVLKTVSFSAPLEAIACTVGDLILVQHDMPNWAQSGRLEAGSTTTTLKLDRPVTIEQGKSYKVLVQHDVLPRYSGTVNIVAQDTLWLNGFPTENAKRVRRLQTNGKDYPVSDQGNGWVRMMQDMATIIGPGQPYTLHDTDVIEEAGVLNGVGEHTTLTLQAPVSASPQQFAIWMFGEVARVKSPFRIKSISSDTELTRQITALQYDERVYDYNRFASVTAPVENPKDAIISHVRELDLYEETRVAGAQVVSQLVAAWRAPLTGQYMGADIFVRKGDSETAWENRGSVKHRTNVEIVAEKGDKIAVKVVAFDMFDKRATFESAPVAEIEVQGELGNVDVGDVTGADVIWSGRDCRLKWRYNSTTHSYEFGSEPTGADAGALDPQFKDYEISTYAMNEPVGGKPRRVEYTTDNSYVYTYEKNDADGLTRKLRFEIRMRDKSNNLGKATSLTAYNPPPRLLSMGAQPTFESATLDLRHSNDLDFKGTMIWLSRDDEDIDGDIYASGMANHLVYDGPDNSIQLTNLMFNATYYVRVACYDVFGKTDLLPSEVLAFQTTHLDVNAIADGVLSGSKLIPALQARIDLVDGPATMAGSVAKRLLDEATARGAAITAEANARQSALDSVASQINTLTTSVGNNAAAISTETTARTTADTALANQISTLAAQVSGDITASIVSEATARANADSAMASQISALQTSVGNNAAAITAEQTARANGDSANASSINTLWTSVNGNTTAIQTQASTVNGLAGQYTVKIDNNGYVAGFGLASYPVNGGITSEFVVRADKFAIQMPGYPGIYPFTVGAVSGIPRVIISSALIGDASISSAKIGNLEVNTHNINTGACSAAAAAETWGTSCGVGVYVPEGAVALVVQAFNQTVTTSWGNEQSGPTTDTGQVYVNGSAWAPGGGIWVNPGPGGYSIVAERANAVPGYSPGPMKLFVTVFKR